MINVLPYIIPIQFIEFFRMLIGDATFYYLPLQFIIFIALALGIRDILAYKNKPNKYADIDPPVSVIVPTYKEDPAIFRKCMEAISKNHPLEIIVVHDDGREDVEETAKLFGATVLSFDKRIGKRRAMVAGWQRAKSDIIVQVDGDEIVTENCFEELIKPLQDRDVVGVQGKNLAYSCGSDLTYELTILQETNRDITCRALRPSMVDIDGRINAWRRDFLLKHVEDFSNEMWMSHRSEIGDDRYLTHIANLEGWKTAYQESAVAYTASPSSFKGYVKQQLRWARSGYKFFFLDVRRGLKPRNSFYYLSQFFFYMSAITFTIAILHDIFFVPPIYTLPPWSSVVMVCTGTTIISIFSATLSGYFFWSYKGRVKELLKFGLVGLFVMYPVMLYALVTVNKQATWGTRT